MTLFEKLDQSPDSNQSRRLVTASNQYGLTKGSYTAEYFELTTAGAEASSDESPANKRASARFALALTRFEPFASLYERLKNNKVPAKEIMIDYAREFGVSEDQAAECVDTFILNAEFLGLLRTISGSQRLVTIEQVIEESTSSGEALESAPKVITTSGAPKVTIETGSNEPQEDFSKICFYVTPIGESGSEHRRHSDFMLEYIIQPAVKEFGLSVVRADQMSKPGMIGRQIIEHILRSKLVIADLSFHNPNVFYELCLRHTTRLATVQLKREIDALPFDLNQYRTISIETRDPYTLLPKVQTYTAEVTNQVRRALQDTDSGDNPISLYYPSARLAWDQKK